MPLVEPVIRPPSEAESFLLQVTAGCSSNTCTFCGAYPRKPFRIKGREEILGDIEEWRSLGPDTRRVFLLDGDALAAGNDLLLPVLERLGRAFPLLARVASYANGQNITGRSDGELADLAGGRLRLVYLGLESGAQEVLDRCRKRATVREMEEAVHRCRDAGIKSSVIVLLGLGGRRLRDSHVEGTVAALNRMQPDHLSFLSLVPVPGTVLYRQWRDGEFELPGPRELIGEARDIIEGLALEGTVFRSDHASNHLPLGGRLPRDRDRLLAVLQGALEGGIPLRPEALRGL